MFAAAKVRNFSCTEQEISNKVEIYGKFVISWQVERKSRQVAHHGAASPGKSHGNFREFSLFFHYRLIRKA